MRLGEPDPDDLLAAADPRHPLRGDLGGGVAGEDLPDERADHLQVGDVDVAAADLLGDDPGGEPVQAPAAELDRDLRGDQPGGADLAAQLRVDPAGLLAGLVAGQQLLRRERAGPVAVLAAARR